MATSSSATTLPPQQLEQKDAVHLLDLAAAAVACTVTASAQIRRLEQQQNARLKADGSFVTDADLTAQAVIVQAIQAINMNLEIVGEESPAEMAQHVDKLVPNNDGGDKNNGEEYRNDEIWRRTRRELEILYQQRNQQPQPPSSVPRMPLAQGPPEPLPDIPDNNSNMDTNSLVIDCHRVSIIVDPLDGTKSYTLGETDAVSILICITVDHEPIFGVVGKPFGYTGLTTILESTCACIYGGPLLRHVYCAGQAQPLVKPAIATTTYTGNLSSPSSSLSLPRAVISKSRSAGVVHDFCVHLGKTGLLHPEPLMVNGAGEKSLRLILPRNGEALWFFPKGGTSRWDVAAPDALLRAMGGKLTDKYGNLLDYNKKREDAENVNGVVACIDAGLHAKCIALFQQDDWLERE